MTDLYFYKYSVEYYDEINNVEDWACGLTVGTSPTDAVARVLKYYGESNVSEFSITCWDEFNCLQLDSETLYDIEYVDVPSAPSADPEPAPAANPVVEKWIADLSPYSAANNCYPMPEEAII